jgi:ABC-type phosphate/phosphonate transport system substrate-binding protein
MSQYRFAVVAKTATTSDFAAAFCARLSHLTGLDIGASVVGSYEQLVAELAQSRCELAWTPPFVALESEASAGVSLLAVVRRSFASGYHSALFARADARIRALSDLQGVTVAWGSPWSASAYIVPRWHLRSKGIDLARAFARELRFARHEAIARAVWERVVDIGACHVGVDPVSGQLASAPWQTVTGALGAMRVLLLVGPIPGDVILATPSLSLDARDRVVAALLSLRSADPGMTELFDATSFEPVPVGHLALLRRRSSDLASPSSPATGDVVPLLSAPGTADVRPRSA